MKFLTEKPEHWTDAMSNPRQLVYLDDKTPSEKEAFEHLNKLFIAAEKRAFLRNGEKIPEYDRTTRDGIAYMAGATYGVITAPFLDPQLTMREREILYLTRLGQTEIEIAKTLNISRGSVSGSKSHAIDKMKIIMPNLYKNIGVLNNNFIVVQN